MMDAERTRKLLEADLETHGRLLREAYRASTASLDEFQAWVHGTLAELGMQPQVFRVSGSELTEQPAFRASYPDPDAVPDGPPNVVGQLNPEAPDGLLLFAHADRKPELYERKDLPGRLVEEGDRYVGAGIADDVSGVAAMLSAVRLCRELGYTPRKRIMVASILGKQGGVFGTYGLMRRYGPLSAALYLHPAESGAGLGELKIASNGLIEFDLRVVGKPPDSTEVHQSIFSASAESAADKLCRVHRELQQWARKQSSRYHHDGLYAQAGQSFALTAGRLLCGQDNEVYEIPTQGRMQGTLAFSSRGTLEVVRREFEEEIGRIEAMDPWLSRGNLTLEYGDRMGEAAEADPQSECIRKSVGIVEAFTGRTPRFFYGHSLSDIRYPLLYWNAGGTYGIGPRAGNLGTDGEWIDRQEYFLWLGILAEILNAVCASR